MESHNRLLEEHAGYRKRQSSIEDYTRRAVGDPAIMRAGPTTLKVAVRIVFRTPDEDISDAQVKSQIAALNRDYGLTNADKSKTPAPWKGLIGNPQITFKLATRDPQGRPTTGITRTQTTRASFGTGDAVKSTRRGGVDAWPTKQYLNIWVCTLQGNLLGYAQFPGGPAKTDGVVIRNTAFGTNGTAQAPFDLGRTATHEVGHYLNLIHIWGDRNDCGGTDFVGDTPNAHLPNQGTPTFPHVSCNNGPNGDMFCNYMDYTDDAAMVMFTAGQVARMRATLNGPRAGLLS